MGKREEAEALVIQHGSIRAAARAAGIAESTLRGRLRSDPAIEAGKKATGAVREAGVMWAKTTKPDENGILYSYMVRGAKDDPGDMIERLESAFQNIAPVDPVPPPERRLSGVLAAYMAFDMHFGMHAWGRQTRGPDYDLGLAVQDMHNGMAAVMDRTADAEDAVVIFGGDTVHMDDDRAETPAHHNKIDVDGRYEKVIDTVVSTIAFIVDRLRQKHVRVRVVILRGNHDPHAHIALRQAMKHLYINEPRVDVWADPFDIFAMPWGRAGLWAQHGDRSKPVSLVLEIADKTPFYSTTPHRYLFLGHKHSTYSEDIGGTMVIGLRAGAPADTYGSKFSGKRMFYSHLFDDHSGLVATAYDPLDRRA